MSTTKPDNRELLRQPDTIAEAISLMTRKRTLPTILGAIPLAGLQTLLSGVFGYSTVKSGVSPVEALTLFTLASVAVASSTHRQAREAISRDISYRWVNAVYSKARYTKGVKMKVDRALWNLRDNSLMLKKFTLQPHSFKMELSGEYPSFMKIRYGLVKTGLALAFGGLILGSAFAGKFAGRLAQAHDAESMQAVSAMIER